MEIDPDVMKYAPLSELEEVVTPSADDFFFLIEGGQQKKSKWANVIGFLTAGWTMQYEDIASGDKVVRKVTGYTGGTGTLPTVLNDTIGKYFASAGGFTTDVNLATDYKGAKGADGKTIETWTAKVYASGSQVFHLGKIWESSAATVAGDVPGTAAVWVLRLDDATIRKVSKYFLEKIDTTLETFDTHLFGAAINGITPITNGLLKNDNTVFTYTESGKSYRLFHNVPTDASTHRITRLSLDVLAVSSGTYAVVVGKKADNSVTVLLSKSTTTTQIRQYDVDLTGYSHFSLFYYSDTTIPNSETDTKIRVYKMPKDATEENAIKKYIDFEDGKIKRLAKYFYEQKDATQEVAEFSLDKNVTNINGITFQSGLLNENNTFTSYSEAGNTYKTFLNVPTAVGTKTIQRIEMSVFLGAAATIHLIGKKADNTTQVLLRGVSPTPSTLQNFNISLEGFTHFSLLLLYPTATTQPISVKIYSLPQGTVIENGLKNYIDRAAKGLNFKDFGAVCDGVTDDSIAFDNAINYLVAQGGGKISVSGTMKIRQSKLPTLNADKWITIEIVGDYTPTGVFGSVGSAPVNTHNSTILCTESTFDANKGVIYAGSDGPWGMTCIMIVIRNVIVRTNGNINGLNLKNFQQAIVRDVNIDTGVYAGQATEPLNQTEGLSLPKRNNAALVITDNVAVSGYWYAFAPQEHANADNIHINCCKVALKISGMGHPAYIKRVLAQKCTRLIEVIDQSTFEVAQLAVEKAAASTITPGHEWQLPDTYDSTTQAITDAALLLITSP